MQTQPVAPLRQAASGPALANLDLSLAFPLADDGVSFVDRLEAAATAAKPVVDAAGDDDSSQRAEKEPEGRASRTPDKKGKAQHDKVMAEQGREPVQPTDPAPVRDMPVARQAEGVAATDSAVESSQEPSVEQRSDRPATDDRRAMKAKSPEESATDSAPAEPSMRQTRLEAESGRRVDSQDRSRPAGDAPTSDAGDGGRQPAGGGAGGGAWQGQSLQRQVASESVARESVGVKSVGGVREAQGPSTGVIGDRVGQSRGGAPETGRAKETKRSLPRFPVPQSQESTMVLRTGKALAAALRGAGDVRLNLSPEELGRVQVRMHSDQEGVSVVLGCERPETVASLESGVMGLRRSLEEQGVRVKEIVVEGPRSIDPAHAADRQADPSMHDRPAMGFDQGARDDGRQDLPARREAMPAPDRGDSDTETDTVVVDGSVGTLLASLDAAGVTAAIDTVV